PLLTFIYLKDKVDGPKDLKGKDIALASPFAKATWPIYLSAVDVKASAVGSAKFAKEDVVAGLIANGKLDAVWASLQQVALYN
ncbi:MAG TPA: ABC transporter substrate-binding protein, partial [Methanomicrobiales archaeon]|nr:ABC transporter substrate-binding protein [Methanomicrobiales archaeon]